MLVIILTIFFCNCYLILDLFFFVPGSLLAGRWNLRMVDPSPCHPLTFWTSSWERRRATMLASDPILKVLPGQPLKVWVGGDFSKWERHFFRVTWWNWTCNNTIQRSLVFICRLLCSIFLTLNLALCLMTLIIQLLKSAPGRPCKP